MFQPKDNYRDAHQTARQNDYREILGFEVVFAFDWLKISVFEVVSACDWCVTQKL